MAAVHIKECVWRIAHVRIHTCTTCAFHPVHKPAAFDVVPMDWPDNYRRWPWRTALIVGCVVGTCGGGH